MNFIIPAILILWGGVQFGPVTDNPVVAKILILTMFFLVFPVSITYLIVSLNKIFPGNLRGSIIFFVPYLVNLIIYLLKFGVSIGFLRVWIIQSLPLFLGYILALITGFLFIVIKGTGNLLQSSLYEIIAAVALILLLTGSFVTSWIYMFLTGKNFLLGWAEGVPEYMAFVYFIFSIAMVFTFHYPLLKKLYKEGSL